MTFDALADLLIAAGRALKQSHRAHSGIGDSVTHEGRTDPPNGSLKDAAGKRWKRCGVCKQHGHNRRTCTFTRVT